MTVHVEMQDVTKVFSGQEVLRGINVKIERGEIFAVVGPSGSGKTTLLRLLNLLDQPTMGKVIIDGLDVSALRDNGLSLRRRMAMVLQKPVVFMTTVFENAAYGLRVRGLEDEEIEERVMAALEGVGLQHLRDRKANTLSGGEAQRLAFARAAVLNPEILLLDEFTANLDPANIAILEKAVREFNEERGGTIVIVTHNMFQAKRVAKRVGFLLEGELVEVADVHTFFQSPRDPRTKSFVNGEMVF